MSANPDLRQVCADIMRGRGNAAGADAIEYAERREYGDPVPADEHAEVLAEIEGQRGDLAAELKEVQEALTHRSKALRNLEKAIVRWDDERDDIALLGAWDEYRRASKR